MPLLKCLIVDDDVLGRELTLQSLDGVAGCDVASNGCEAMELFEAALDGGTPYDLIMLDLLMPGMNGYETGTAIRQMEKARGIAGTSRVNIIIISSVNTPQEIVHAYMTAQSAAHLSKPVRPEKLRNTLVALGMIPE